VRWLDFAQLEAAADDFDALVAASPDVDGFCSSTPWILPARVAFTPQAPPLVGAGENGVAAMMIVPVSGGAPAAVALEASWGLASPFASPDPAALVAELYAALRAPARRRVAALVVTGITGGGAAMRALERGARRALFPAGPPTQRISASLQGGVDGFLARRSPKLRATVRRALRLARASGLRLERGFAFAPDEVTRLLDRAIAVERRSWKAVDGGGLTDTGMETFYRHMLPRLARRGALRSVFVTDGERDVAFCFGGVVGGIYRGLQSSYDEAHAQLSPGALVHFEMISLLCEEGATVYDLGTDMDYKRRWGEPALETVSCVAVV
jgi:CelD/BcsL family acetyltransferase involved in cellulose biosynthesis